MGLLVIALLFFAFCVYWIVFKKFDYAKVTLYGSSVYMTLTETITFLHEADDPKQYAIEFVKLTAMQFDEMDDFHGW